MKRSSSNGSNNNKATERASKSSSTDGSIATTTSSVPARAMRMNAKMEKRTEDCEKDECNSTDTDVKISAQQQIGNDDDASIQSQCHPHEATFPQQLMDLIESETTDDNAVSVSGQKAIEWLSNGDKFIIRDKAALESLVLPKYFNKKCKFMSFVRKLYRWGFRQVEKDFSSGTMIFKHKHFTRGDKKKCLAMHSIVNSKKPSAPSTTPINVSSHRVQGFGDINTVVPFRGGVANHLHQLHSNRQAVYGGSYGVAGNVGQGTAAYNMLDGRTNLSLPINYHGLGLQMQPQRNNYLNGLNWATGAIQEVPGLPSNHDESTQQISLAAALQANHGYNVATNQSRPRASPADEVHLASLIMREDQTIDARRALHLAKMHLNGSSTITGDPRRPN